MPQFILVLRNLIVETATFLDTYVLGIDKDFPANACLSNEKKNSLNAAKTLGFFFCLNRKWALERQIYCFRF